MALKGLIIREPWIGEILAGRKTWELRSTPFRYRGELALIRQGSGLVVGMATLADCLAPQSKDELRASALFHRWPVDKLDELIAKNWCIPWVLSDVRPLPHPVRYVHRSGAVKTVTIDEQAEREIRQQLLRLRPELPARAAPRQRLHVEPPPPTPLALSTHSGAERARLMSELAHFRGTSVNSITDADIPRLRLASQVLIAAKLPPEVAVASQVKWAPTPILQPSWKKWLAIFRMAVGVIATLVAATCALIWLGQIGSGLVHALLTWNGVRWIIWSMMASVVAGMTIGDTSGRAAPASTAKRTQRIKITLDF